MRDDHESFVVNEPYNEQDHPGRGSELDGTYEPVRDPRGRGQRPDMIAYSVRDTSEGKSYWNRVGVSFEHRDGKGSDVVLDSVPINGRITLREYREQRFQENDQGRSEKRSNGRDQDRGERNMSRGRA